MSSLSSIRRFGDPQRGLSKAQTEDEEENDDAEDEAHGRDPALLARPVCSSQSPSSMSSPSSSILRFGDPQCGLSKAQTVDEEENDDARDVGHGIGSSVLVPSMFRSHVFSCSTTLSCIEHDELSCVRSRRQVMLNVPSNIIELFSLCS
jgi:hypothetical protein